MSFEETRAQECIIIIIILMIIMFEWLLIFTIVIVESHRLERYLLCDTKTLKQL